jgi:hypothetical protein
MAPDCSRKSYVGYLKKSFSYKNSCASKALVIKSTLRSTVKEMLRPRPQKIQLRMFLMRRLFFQSISGW